MKGINPNGPKAAETIRDSALKVASRPPRDAEKLWTTLRKSTPLRKRIPVPQRPDSEFLEQFKAREKERARKALLAVLETNDLTTV